MLKTDLVRVLFGKLDLSIGQVYETVNGLIGSGLVAERTRNRQKYLILLEPVPVSEEMNKEVGEVLKAVPESGPGVDHGEGA